MKNNAMINEKMVQNVEVMNITSAAGTTSHGYDMQGYDQALLTAGIRGNFTTVTVDLMESSAATVAGTSAAGSKAGMVLGGASTLISATTGGVRELTLTFTTATTANDTIRITGDGVAKTFTNINTTANLNATAWTSTNLYFGSTVGSSANTGLSLRLDSLKTAINSTIGFGTGIVCSTASTAAITLAAANIEGALGFNTTFAVPTAAVNEAVGAFNIQADQLDSTAAKRFVSIKVSTAATACNVAFSAIRTGGSYNPPSFAGRLST